MFHKIQNPETGKWVNINGRVGQKVLRNYMKQYGAAGPDFTNLPDLYDILGLDSSATPDEIKKAYRNLARRYHPDSRAKGTRGGDEEKFKEIQTAYEVLSVTSTRQLYDIYLVNCQRQRQPYGYQPHY